LLGGRVGWVISNVVGFFLSDLRIILSLAILSFVFWLIAHFLLWEDSLAIFDKVVFSLIAGLIFLQWYLLRTERRDLRSSGQLFHFSFETSNSRNIWDKHQPTCITSTFLTHACFCWRHCLVRRQLQHHLTMHRYTGSFELR